MPKREYIHCIRCQAPLERPIIKRCETETWYVDFAACRDCKKAMMAMQNPSIEIILDGDTLKTLLDAKPDYVMVATTLDKGKT